MFRDGKDNKKIMKRKKKSQLFNRWLSKLAWCGDGGSRTLVQTRNPQGFYMLIQLLVFVPGKEADVLNPTLSPKFNSRVGAPCERSRN